MIIVFFILGDLLAVAILTGALCRIRRLSNGWIGIIAGSSYGLISITIEATQGCLVNQWESMCGFIMGVMHLPVALLLARVQMNPSIMVTLFMLVAIDALIGYTLIGKLLLGKILPRK